MKLQTYLLEVKATDGKNTFVALMRAIRNEDYDDVRYGWYYPVGLGFEVLEVLGEQKVTYELDLD